ncbi:hypothetical protein E2I00_011417, partial [Balaenoptera physalus]
TSRFDANASQILKIINITAISEVNEPMDETIGSPPPAGSKMVVFGFRSVNSIVILAANTGNDNSSNTAHGLGFQLRVDIQFSLYRHRLQLLMMQVVVGRRVEVIRSLYDLYGERLYRVPQHSWD